MRRILYYVIGTVLVFYGWHHYRQARFTEEETASAPDPAALAVERPAGGDSGYRCDGRAFCSQMHSCEEATWFLKDCPDMKMDGDNDGIPCERQWCVR